MTSVPLASRRLPLGGHASNIQISDCDILRCPRCSDQLVPNLLDINEQGNQTVWWTCCRVNASKGPRCTFPLDLPADVFWITRSASDVRNNIIPRPKIRRLPKRYHYLYPSVFVNSATLTSSGTRRSLLSRSDGISVASSGVSDQSRRSSSTQHSHIPAKRAKLSKGVDEKSAAAKDLALIVVDSDDSQPSSPSIGQFFSAENMGSQEFVDCAVSSSSVGDPNPELIAKVRKQFHISELPDVDGTDSAQLLAVEAPALSSHCVPKPAIVKTRVINPPPYPLSALYNHSTHTYNRSLEPAAIAVPTADSSLVEKAVCLATMRSYLGEDPTLFPLSTSAHSTYPLGHSEVEKWKMRGVVAMMVQKKKEQMTRLRERRQQMQAQCTEGPSSEAQITPGYVQQLNPAPMSPSTAMHDHIQNAEMAHLQEDLRRKLHAKMERYKWLQRSRAASVAPAGSEWTSGEGAAAASASTTCAVQQPTSSQAEPQQQFDAADDWFSGFETDFYSHSGNNWSAATNSSPNLIEGENEADRLMHDLDRELEQLGELDEWECQ